MKKGILITILILGLIACGDTSSDKQTTLDVNFPASALGLTQEPELTELQISHGDEI